MKRDETVAVMVSGGVDSLVAWKLAKTRFKRVLPMFVNLQQPYVGKEFNACYSLFKDLVVVKADLCNDYLDNIPTVDRQEIWGRNLLIAFYGAVVADRVWLAALETEMNPTAVRDKHPEFFYLCSALFTYVFKGLRFETVVETPFSELTKSEVVRLGLELGLTKEEILKTTSCYDPNHHTCGRCSTCFKRWIALTNNEITEVTPRKPWLENPYGQSVVREMRELVKHGKTDPRFSQKRMIETHNALVKTGLNGIWMDVAEIK